MRKGATARWLAGHDQDTVWELASPKQLMAQGNEEPLPHPAQKPCECMARPLRNHAGEVYDPFLGSGTTLIAVSRRAASVMRWSSNRATSALAVRRWELYTGKRATREEHMAKATSIEVERRVDELYELVVNRISYRQIVRYCEGKWGIGERQVCVYIAKVRERMAALCCAEQSAELAQALAGYEAIFARQMAAGHYGGARETLDSIVRCAAWPPPSAMRSQATRPCE